MVQGLGEEVGAALVGDPRVRRISFTGSPETGRLIGVEAARNLVPFTAELGGKGPFVVFADADLDAAARKAAADVRRRRARSASRAPGCSSSRAFRASSSPSCVGTPRPMCLVTRATPATTISPLIHPDHLARVAGFVERSRAAGDTVVFGGSVWREGGLWYEPTLIEPASNDSEIVQREVFGPVLTFQTFDDEADAVRLANSTQYGLSAIVFTADRARAERMGDAIRAGTIWTNCFLVRDLTAPVRGTKISGIGREGGDYALDFYSELKMFQVMEGSTDG